MLYQLLRRETMGTQKQGYILVFTLIIIAITTALATYVYNRGIIFFSYTSTILDQERARQLALGGVNIAYAQLNYQEKKDEKEKKGVADTGGEKEEKKDSEEKAFLKRLLPTLNRWQEYSFSEDKDGLDGTVRFCVVCEQGKININSMYDFQKHAFIGDEKEEKGGNKVIVQNICSRLEKELKIKDLFASLEQFLKKREYPLNDITELLAIKDFVSFKGALYYDPPQTKEKQYPLYLTDIFTVYSPDEKIEPWLLSDSVCGICGLGRVQFDDGQKRKKMVQEWTKPFTESTNWKDQWATILKPMYEKELQSLPEGIDSIFSTTFSPTCFSIIAEAVVGKAARRIWVVCERHKKEEQEKTEYEMRIKRIYWL
ncbi:MAG TPA: hypothetical protein VEK38_01425 [Candidatus Bathyarchaeia archaeon]|nr:hypothetical protein [Candidatus Bathyarchaeia archaeon]